MKLLVIGNADRAKKYSPSIPMPEELDIVVVERGTSDADILALASDADFIMADAISPVSETLISGMPNLKLIHSEGVGVNAIDLDAAKAHGVPVCNNAGVNAAAVAEQTILLMLASLRQLVIGDTQVRQAKQIQMKERLMVEGVRELGDCTIGFIGFGAIAQATALRLANWGCTMLYNKRHPLDAAQEAELNVQFASQDEIVEACDIVSIHVPVTPETEGLVNRDFLSRMKPDAILINTARGEVIDQEALAWALETSEIAGAGLDVLSPEPVQPDNPLLNLSAAATDKLVLSPHIGGITEGMFFRAYEGVWNNVARVMNGEEPINRVA